MVASPVLFWEREGKDENLGDRVRRVIDFGGEFGPLENFGP
jgi:hypothetical protein